MTPSIPSVIVALFAFALPAARAEYRAFQLQITNTKTGAVRLATSTLDDIQYPGYYPLRQFETVAIVDTWMCWGRTGDFKRICPNPRPPSGPGAPDAKTRPTASSAPTAPSRP